MEVQEIRTGLWRWTADHPDWKAEDDWEPGVACVYYEAPDAVILIDPLVPADEEGRFWQALDRDVERLGQPVACLLTVPWHERSVRAIHDRYGAEVWCAESEWRKKRFVTHAFAPGDPLPGGVVGHAVPSAVETVYELRDHRTLVPGDSLLGVGDGALRLCPESWLEGSPDPSGFLPELRRLLARDVEIILTSHGPPVLDAGHAALAAVLGQAPSAA